MWIRIRAVIIEDCPWPPNTWRNWLEAVDYLLKPLEPEQVTEAVNRLLAYLRPFEVGSSWSSARCAQAGVGTKDTPLTVRDHSDPDE